MILGTPRFELTLEQQFLIKGLFILNCYEKYAMKSKTFGNFCPCLVRRVDGETFFDRNIATLFCILFYPGQREQRQQRNVYRYHNCHHKWRDNVMHKINTRKRIPEISFRTSSLRTAGSAFIVSSLPLYLPPPPLSLTL